MPPVKNTYTTGVKKKRKGLPKYILQRDDADVVDVFDALNIDHIKTLKAQSKPESKKTRTNKIEKKSHVPILEPSADDTFDRLLLEGPVARQLPNDHVRHESTASEISSSSSESEAPLSFPWICDGEGTKPVKLPRPKFKTFFKKVGKKKVSKLSLKQKEWAKNRDSDGNQKSRKSIEPALESFVEEEAQGGSSSCKATKEKLGPPESASTPLRQHHSSFFSTLVSPIGPFSERQFPDEKTSLHHSVDRFDSEDTFQHLIPVATNFCGVCGGPQCEDCSCAKLSDSDACRLKERRFEKTFCPPVKSNSSRGVDVRSLIAVLKDVSRDESLLRFQVQTESDHQDVPAFFNVKESSLQRSRIAFEPSQKENCSLSESRSKSFNKSEQMSKEPCNEVQGNDFGNSKAEGNLLQPYYHDIHPNKITSACQNSNQDIFADSLSINTSTSIIGPNLKEISLGRNGNEQTRAQSIIEAPEIDIKLASNNSSITKADFGPSLRPSMRPSHCELQPVVLKSGKHYRRSLSILRAQQSIPIEGSPLNLNQRRSSIQPVKGRRWESTVNHIREIQLFRDVPVEVSYHEQNNVPLPLVIVPECSNHNHSSPSMSSTDFLGDAKLEVLQRCGQEQPLPFIDCYPASLKPKCAKIGEGVYGEVFMYKGCKDRYAAVIKVIPIEGDLVVNGEPQKKFHEILSEICIAQELTKLRNEGDNSTAMFNEVIAVRCVQGAYPLWLTELWYEYDSNKGSENDAPDLFEEHQLYIVLELSNGGKDLESFVFSSADQGLAAFKQVTLTLAVGESALQFEHRDLHWGNVLITPCKERKVQFMLDGDCFQFPSKGLKVSLIDFTLSRMTNPSTCHPIFCDLAKDETLFTAQGDYQFEVYRLMKECTMNEWSNFAPKTNIVWLHYLLDKLCTMARYRNRGSKIHQHALDTLQEMRDTVLAYPSAAEFAKTSYFKN